MTIRSRFKEAKLAQRYDLKNNPQVTFSQANERLAAIQAKIRELRLSQLVCSDRAGHAGDMQGVDMRQKRNADKIEIDIHGYEIDRLTKERDELLLLIDLTSKRMARVALRLP